MGPCAAGNQRDQMPTIGRGSPAVRPAVPAEATGRAARSPGIKSLNSSASRKSVYQLPGSRTQAGPTVLRELLRGVLKSGPGFLVIGLAAADLLFPRPVNRSEVGLLKAERRADQFVGDLNEVGVGRALSRLSTGLFANDISVARLGTELSGLEKAIARGDSIAARRHFNTIAKAMAFNTSATNAGVAAVDSEIARLKKASAPRLSAPVSPRAPGKAEGASNLPHNVQAARARRNLAPETPPSSLPALGGSRAATPQQPARLKRKSRVTHTDGTGTQAEVEARSRRRGAEALRAAVSEANARKRLQTPSGRRLSDLAQEVHEKHGLNATGISATQLKAALETIASASPSGVQASGSGGSSGGSGASSGGEQLATGKQILVDEVNKLLRESGYAGKFDTAGWVERWLERPNMVLGGSRPRDYMGTAEGTKRLLELIGAMAADSYL